MSSPAQTGLLGVVKLSATPTDSANPTAVVTEDQRLPTATGARQVHVTQKAGATFGDKLQTAETECAGIGCEIIAEVDGPQAVNTPVTFAPGHTVRITGSGTLTNNSSGGAFPYLIFGSNTALLCDSDAVIIHAPSGSGSLLPC